MDAFERLDAIAAPLDIANADTDQIVPARFLWKPRADGFGPLLFIDLRTDESGSPKSGFVLDEPAFRSARILVADDNFGCGSSREHAVWALLDAGIRSVIAPSFGDIFYGNALKNGLLPVVLPAARCARLREQLHRFSGSHLIVDLEAQMVTDAVGETDHFQIADFRKQLLLLGMDDITYTLQLRDRISSYEEHYDRQTPWL
jgi:3-isopropylmalate/(R)-2-methylmalate dehydratase small subunit